MYKIFIALVLSLFFVPVCFAQPECIEAEAETESHINECPHYGFKSEFKECRECHIVPGWEVKKGKQFAQYEYARPYGVHLRDENGAPVVYVKIVDIKDENIDDGVRFAKYLDIKKMVVEIHSPGGSLFDAQRIVGLLDEYKEWGGVVETRVNGFAASAGFYIFMNGDARFISPTAQLMWHELYTFTMFKISEPSDSEDEARVLRHLQDTVNEWIASRCNLTKDELDSMVKKKELWANGTMAVEYGFATGLIGG